MGWQGRTHFLDWYESDPNDRNTDFTYHSHQGKSRNFTSIGQLCFGFVRLQENDDKWLLVSAGKITSIPDADNIGTCGHEELPDCELPHLIHCSDVASLRCTLVL